MILSEEKRFGKALQVEERLLQYLQRAEQSEERVMRREWSNLLKSLRPVLLVHQFKGGYQSWFGQDETSRVAKRQGTGISQVARVVVVTFNYFIFVFNETLANQPSPHDARPQ